MRTMPNGRSGRPSSWWTESPELEPSLRARAGVADRRGRGRPSRDRPGHGRRRSGQHRQPPSVGRIARHGPRGRSHRADRQQGDRLRAGRRAGPEGQGQPGPGLPCDARRRGTGRPELERDARGAVHRSRHGTQAAQGSLCGDGPGTTDLARLADRPGAASARVASRGSSRSTSTAWSTTCTGIPAGLRRTGTASPSGPSARWSAVVPGSLPRTTNRRRGGRSPTRSRSGCPDEAERRWVGDGPAGTCSQSNLHRPAGATASSPAWRTYFERIGAGRDRHRARVRGPPLGGPRPPRLHRSSAGVVDRGAHPGRDPRPPGAPRAPPGMGCGTSELRRVASRSAVR